MSCKTDRLAGISTQRLRAPRLHTSRSKHQQEHNFAVPQAVGQSDVVVLQLRQCFKKDTCTPSTPSVLQAGLQKRQHLAPQQALATPAAVTITSSDHRMPHAQLKTSPCR